MATVRLFDNDAYKTEGYGTVVSCVEEEHNGQKCFALVLDSTIFFPEEGGQSPDKGFIDNAEVLDVQVKQGIITHYVTESFDEGSSVCMKLDMNHRFSNMQQHSGEHIFSGLVYTLFGYSNVGFHLSDNSVTMDFDGLLTKEDLEMIETKVNEAISRNLEVTARYYTKEELALITYRSKKELEGPVRIVTIPGFDTCACCAPHVKRTGEIGMLKIIHSQNYKGGVRIHILCGFRALEYYRESLALIDSLTGTLTTGRESLLENVEKLKAENMSLSSKLLNAKQELLHKELDSLSEELPDVILCRDKTDSLIIRNAVNYLTAKHSGFCGFFSGNDETGYTFIIASATKDARELSKKLADTLSAKGGGKPQMVQGNISATKEQIQSVLGIDFV